MNFEIKIKWSDLRQQIDLRNFYMGESAKRNDINADTMQSSNDDEKLLLMFTQRACNELITTVAVRFPSITSNADTENITITFESETTPPQHLLTMLKQAISDYIVNDVNMHWLLTVKPEMAQTNISLRSVLYSNVQMMFAKIYNRQKLRRRSTNLAGI
ncbi:MAG: hypothetical protein J6U58_07460 [Bacteroidaceae bacterium]|nr:hypothetical protein [Bacteroidaceae bacterium]